ncbi:hypothetical protein RYX36_030118, partial [Vicia faba]
ENDVDSYSIEVEMLRNDSSIVDTMTVDDVNDTPETVELNQGKKRFKQNLKEKLSKRQPKRSCWLNQTRFQPSRAKRKVSSDVVSIVAQSDEISTTTTIQTETWAVLAHKKPQKDWIAYNPRTMRPLPLSRDTKFVKLLSWNVNGLRALLKLEGFSALQLAQREDFDVLCLQETKLQEKDIEEIKQRLLDGYENSFWTCSVSKLGYSGTAIISRVCSLCSYSFRLN